MKLNYQSETPELDLADPETAKQLIEMDCLRKPDPAESEVEQAIKQNKPLKVTLSFSGGEAAAIQRQADTTGQTPKEYLSQAIKQLLVDRNIGKPLVSAPSVVSGRKVTKVGTPTYNVTRLDS